MGVAPLEIVQSEQYCLSLLGVNEVDRSAVLTRTFLLQGGAIIRLVVILHNQFLWSVTCKGTMLDLAIWGIIYCASSKFNDSTLQTSCARVETNDNLKYFAFWCVTSISIFCN